MNITENPKTKLHAKNSPHGLNIYIDISGKSHLLAVRRPNGSLYLWLKDGKTLGELKRFRPRRKRIDQKRHGYAQYLLKLVDDLVKSAQTQGI